MGRSMILKVSICIHPQKNFRAVNIWLPTFSGILEKALLLLKMVGVVYFNVDDIKHVGCKFYKCIHE